MSGFNLVDQPWVPVRTHSGTRLASLREATCTPEAFLGLDPREPDEFFGLLRLLTTIVNRALLGPPNPEAWAEIAYGDGYDVDRIGAYLDAWRHRFELFDPERPFLQYPELAGLKDGSVLQLLPDAASGNAITLFSHTAESDPLTLGPAEAARYVAHVVLNGRGSLKGGEYGVFGARVAVLGDTLRDTIIENLPKYGGEAQDGIPVWERPSARPLADPPRSPQPCRGLLDLATWQWRAVLLLPDDDGLVRRCVFTHGPKVDGEEPRDPSRWYDPVPEKDRAKNPTAPLHRDRRLRPDRDVWRDADALTAALARRDMPGVLAWNHTVRDREVFQVLVGGPIAELKGSWVVTGVRAGSLPIPRAVIEDERLLDRVASGVAHANARAQDLRAAVWFLAREMVRQGAESASKKRADDVAHSIDPLPRFWAALPPAFADFLGRIADPEAMEDWRATVDTEARRALDEVVSGLATTPRSLRAAAAAHRRLRGAPRDPGASNTPAPDQTVGATT